MMPREPRRSVELQSDARTRGPYLVLALLLALVAAIPLWSGPGVVYTRAGGDVPFLWQRTLAISANLAAGIFPARWMPSAAYGLGYPALDYYAALPYYVASLFDLSGLGVLNGIRLTQTLGFLLAGGGMYLLVRRLSRRGDAALLASAIYTFAPFHLVNVYVRGDALSEFFAIGLYPVVLWALLRLVEKPQPGRCAALAAVYAALVLSHNISALVSSPVAGLALLWADLAAPREQRGRILLWGALGLGLGLLLSAWFWAPALREAGLVQLGDQTTGYFHFAGHFRGRDLVQSAFLHDYAIDSEGSPFSMGLVEAILGAAGLLAALLLWARRKGAGYALFAVLVLLIYTWLITPLSRPAWEHLPLLAYTQFPWRLLSIQAVAIALLSPNLLDLAPRRAARWLALALALICAVAGMARLDVDRLAVREIDLTPERMMLYESYSGNIGGTVRYEYLPQQMVPRPYTSGVQLAGGAEPSPLVLEGSLADSALLERGPQSQRWRLDVTEKALLAFHLTYFPGWEASVDGRTLGVEPLEGLGLVGLRLEPGEHDVRLRLGKTLVRRYADWLSALAALLWLGLVTWPWRRLALGRLLASVGVLGLSILWIAWGPKPEPRLSAANLLVMDFARAPYLHNEPDGLLFGEENESGAWLTAAVPSTTLALAGQSVEVDLTWRELAPEQAVRLRVMGLTAHYSGPAPVWAQTSAPIDSARQTLTLTLADDIPPGLYAIELRVRQNDDDVPIHAPNGRGLEHVSLQPLQVVGQRPASDDEPVLGSYGPEQQPPVASLIAAKAQQRGDRVEVWLTWRNERQAPLNYMLSVRLDDAQGQRLVTRDLAPLLGGYPTSLWRPGELVTDRVLLELEHDDPVAPGATVEIVLYDRVSLQSIGSTRLSLAELLAAF